MKKFMTALLCVMMITAFMPVTSFAAKDANGYDPDYPVHVYRDGKCVDNTFYINGVNDSLQDGDTIILSDNCQSIRRTSFVDKKNITIKSEEGKRYTIETNTFQFANNSGRGEPYMFYIGEGTNVTIENIDIDAQSMPTKSTFALYDEGTLELKNCALKNGCQNTIEIVSGKVTMTDCTITGNKSKGTVTYDHDLGYHVIANNGAAVNVGAGSIFTMNGGTIEGNTGMVAPALLCSGEAVINHGGKIQNNTATHWCGAVNVVGAGKVTLNSGQITGNTVETTPVTEDGELVAGNSGAVMVESIDTGSDEPAAFVMNGGMISGNSCRGNGGGIHAFTRTETDKDAVIEINGGEISDDNMVTSDESKGKSIYMAKNTILKLQGTPAIGGTVYLDNQVSGASYITEGPLVEVTDGFTPGKAVNLEVWDTEEDVKVVQYPVGVTANPGDFKLNGQPNWTLAKSKSQPDSNLVFWPYRTFLFNCNDAAGTVLTGSANVGSLLMKPSAGLPVKDGYTIEGWYRDTGLTDKWNFDQDVAPEPDRGDPTVEIPLYAKWVKNAISGGTLSYTIKAEATEGGTISPNGEKSVIYGGNLTYKITPSEGYSIKDVLVDGKSVGAVQEYTFENVKSSHTVKAMFEVIPEKDLSFLKEIKLQARSKLTKNKNVYVRWKAIKGSLEGLEGYEVFRSTKKSSGYGKKPYFETKKTHYTNNKALKKGTRYYYKVRGFVTVDGIRHYTGWSLKAWRLIPKK